MGALGGRAAEDVVFGEGEITTGAGVISNKLLQWPAKWLLDLE